MGNLCIFAEIRSRSVWSDGEADEVWLYAFFGGRPNLPKCFAFLTNQLNFELTVLPLCVPSANPTNVAIRSQLPSDIDRRVIHFDCSGGQIGWGKQGQRSYRAPDLIQPCRAGSIDGGCVCYQTKLISISTQLVVQSVGLDDIS